MFEIETAFIFRRLFLLYLTSNLIMNRVSTTLLSLLIISGSFIQPQPYPHPQPSITGAWINKEGDDEHTLICSGGYTFMVEYNAVNTAFYYAGGGRYTEKEGMIIFEYEFSKKKEEQENVGIPAAMKFSISRNKLTVFGTDSSKNELTRVDDGTGALAGIWQLKSQLSNGKLEEIKEPMKTLKIVSGTLFQCVTFNTVTNEFLGCYGGRYTYKDGKYTERIEFYWKKPDKVGTAVSFDAGVDNNTWTIKQGSSKKEEWTRGS